MNCAFLQVGCFAVAFGLVCSQAAAAESPADQNSSPAKFPAQVQNLLLDMDQALSASKSLEVDVASTISISSRGTNQTDAYALNVQVAKPQNFSLQLTSGDAVSMVSDGTTMTIYSPQEKKFKLTSAPDSVDELAQGTIGELMNYGPNGMAMASLLSDSPSNNLLKDVTTGTYVGKEDIGGKQYHRLRFQAADYPWDIWLAADGPPLPRRIVPELTAIVKKQMAKAGAGGDASAEAIAEFTNWQLNAKIDPAVFKFDPPEDATEVRPTRGTKMEDMGQELVGKAAPDFELTLIDGSKFKLSDAKGKKVVILDFWATWCPPCRISLPMLVEIEKSYASKDVVLIGAASDQGEDEDAVRKYLKEKGLQLKTGIDADSQVAQKYDVESIPHTFIIGKDGIVHAAHVGLLPSFKRKTEDALKKLTK